MPVAINRPAITLLVAGATGTGAGMGSADPALVAEVTVLARLERALSTAV
jgi:hypothetical protein